MPSLRHPVGPLPASIYWRRRFVALVVLLAVAALVLWLSAGGGGDGQAKSAHPAPVQSITPGTGPSGSAITTRPGGGGAATGGATTGGATANPSSTATGTDGGTTTGDGGSGSTDGGSVSGGTGGSDVSLSGGATGGTSNDGTGASSGGGAGTSGGTGGTASGGSGGGGGTVQVNTPAVRALPICPTSRISLELTSAQNAYQPADRPRFQLTVHNSGGACRADLGRAASLVTVSEASDGRVWSSGDCPTDKSSKWVGIAAGGAVTETFVWDRSRSTPQCPTPAPGGSAGDGVYLVEATLSGVSGTPVNARASFRLES